MSTKTENVNLIWLNSILDKLIKEKKTNTTNYYF